MSAEPFGRLDNHPELREKLLPYCRLKANEIWEDKVSGHKVAVIDATKKESVINKNYNVFPG